MSERFKPQVDALQYDAELRAFVADSMKDAIYKVALIHNMGTQNAEAAWQAVVSALEEDVKSKSSETLKRVAEEAAEKSFAELGFKEARVMADLYVALDDELKARLESEKME